MFEQIGRTLRKFHKKRIIKDDIKSAIVNDFMSLNSKEIRVYMSMTKRSVSDIEIRHGDNKYLLDIKIYNEKSETSVSNLISINRIKDALEDGYEFYFVFIRHVDGIITDIDFQSIYSLKWKYISLQNLGKGQMQIKNLSNTTSYDNLKTKAEWLKEFKEHVLTFYDRLILKISENKSNWQNAFVDN